jgi:hypothetical protein
MEQAGDGSWSATHGRGYLLNRISLKVMQNDGLLLVFA